MVTKYVAYDKKTGEILFTQAFIDEKMQPRVLSEDEMKLLDPDLGNPNVGYILADIPSESHSEKQISVNAQTKTLEFKVVKK